MAVDKLHTNSRRISQCAQVRTEDVEVRMRERGCIQKFLFEKFNHVWDGVIGLGPGNVTWRT